MPSLIDLRCDGAVATITLSNPARRNAMTRAMWRDLRAAVIALSSSENNSYSCYVPKVNSQITCIVIQGEAGHFCAGGDISEYPEFRFDKASLQAFHEDDVAPALHALLACDVPVVAQIEGNCMGAGVEIAACCDVRIATESAIFGAPIAKLGMPMAPQELAIVLRAAGEATIREMLLEARIFTASDMLVRGFVQRTVGDDQIFAEVQNTVQRIGMLSPQAARLNKQALRHFYASNRLPDQQNIAQVAINNVAKEVSPFAYASSQEHVEGITAFIEKRTPKF